MNDIGWTLLCLDVGLIVGVLATTVMGSWVIGRAFAVGLGIVGAVIGGWALCAAGVTCGVDGAAGALAGAFFGAVWLVLAGTLFPHRQVTRVA